MKLVRQQTTRVPVPELAEGKYTHTDTRVFVQCNHAFIPAKVFIATLLMRGRGGERMGKNIHQTDPYYDILF